MPNIVLLGYDLDQPSFRHRMRSLVRPLEVAGWAVRTERFPSGRYGLRTWERRALFRWADVVVLHQIKLSAIEARLFAACSRRRVFDVDDAIYVRKPRRLGEPADESLWRRKKFAATCRAVDAVAAGNEVLAGVARESAHAVEILPTSIDSSAYQTSAAGGEGPVTIAWIGSPENLTYLEMIRPALGRLTVPELAGDQRGARRLERGLRGSLARRRSNRGHASYGRCLVARQVCFQIAAVHGRLAPLRGLARRCQHRGRHRRIQRLSRNGRSRLGAQSRAADHFCAAARTARRQRPCPCHEALLAARLSDAVPRAARAPRCRLTTRGRPTIRGHLPSWVCFPLCQRCMFIKSSTTTRRARRSIRAFWCSITPPTSGPTGTSTGRYASSCASSRSMRMRSTDFCLPSFA